MPEKKYTRIFSHSILNIDRLIGISYRVLDNGFKDRPEKHNFWELVYVNAGELSVLDDEEYYTLSMGEFYLHRPNSLHMVKQLNNHSAKFVIATFDCGSDFLKNIESYKFSSNVFCSTIIKNLINELQNASNVKINNDIFVATAIKETEDDYISLQCMKIYLELLFINAIRLRKKPEHIGFKQEDKYHQIPMCNNIIMYLKANVYNSIDLKTLCRELGYGRTTACTQFKQTTGFTIKHYYIKLKIDEAKTLLQNADNNVSQVSDMLCFSSPDYFSACFKRLCGLSPTQYRVLNL